ncbi:uncharacterized protein LOC124534824 [Vanessa cardui]|uniref:uncharacterized protein LOC124534824 n=1 Tax=Vanessa cardui TaxID=171605 RepID=UPI001F1445C7|nr:uncharacterized protein LOC124534824 [Vanessa cardui]
MCSKGSIVIITIFMNITFLLAVQTSELGLEDIELHRSRRQLLFPNSTLLQLNIGLGTPTPIKTINVNWAIQANFQLPWNRTQIPTDIFGANSGYVSTARKKRELEADYENNAKLYHFYKYVEEVLNGFGQNGTSCVLRTLCQLGAEPLHSVNNEDLLHEIATFILNPINDVTGEKDEESTNYVEAFEAGQNNQDCHLLYDNCTLSLIDLFTVVH